MLPSKAAGGLHASTQLLLCLTASNIAKQGMRRVDNSIHRKSRRLLKNIVILPVENPSHHTDNAKKCGAQKIADTLRTRMLGKSPVCQNSGVGKKAKCWKTAINASSGAKHRFPIEGKKFFPADVLRAFANTHARTSTRKIYLFGNEPSGSRTHDRLLRRDAHRFPFRELHCPVMPDFPAFPADFYVFDGGQRNVKNRNFQPCC